MFQLRTAVKLTFALLAVWLGLVWAGLLPRPAFLPPELDIEPLTFLLGTIAALLLGFWKNNDAKSEGVTGSHPLTEPDESLQAEIRKYLKSRYEHRIRQKLAGREPVNLRKIPSSTGTSDEGAQNFITLPAEKVPSGMAELFDEARGRLLIVGAPGAGKTTLLLQLALALLERPGKDLPVLLNLATWRSEFATFDEWLQRILPLELGASKALAEKIRRNTPLILLLDGLDEVPKGARASCLKAIGEYGAEASRRFVISSRIAEYAATEDVRNVYLEVEVQPLTPQQVIDNLTAYVFHQPEAKPLLNALKTDPLLREAIANPFYLNTAQLLFATGRKYSDFGFTATDVAGRQRELVERFVEDALGRKAGRKYPKENVLKWLNSLAKTMEKNRKIIFELVDMTEWAYWPLNQKSKFKMMKFQSGLAISIVIFQILALLFMVNKYVNLGIVPSGVFFLLSLIICLSGIMLIFTIPIRTKDRLIMINNPYQRFYVSLLKFNFAIFNHLFLRFVYYLFEALPLRLVTFLNEMSLRHLLEFDGDPETGKGGGSWRWRHRIIQEYFLEARGEE